MILAWFVSRAAWTPLAWRFCAGHAASDISVAVFLFGFETVVLLPGLCRALLFGLPAGSVVATDQINFVGAFYLHNAVRFFRQQMVMTGDDQIVVTIIQHQPQLAQVPAVQMIGGFVQ